MRRLLSRNAKIALGVLPLLVGCALATEGDPPPPILDQGDGGEGDTGGTGVGGSGLGGTSTGGVSGSSSGTSGTTGGSTPTGGSGGSMSTGGSGGSTSTGGSSGSGMTGGSAGSGMTGGSAGKGGSGGTGGTSGSAGKGGSAGSGGTPTGGTGGKGGSGGGAAGGPPGGMNLFSDNFEMGTANWTATPAGTWAIATDGTMVYAATGAASNSTWRAAVAGEATWTDVQIDARVKVTSFPGSSTSYYVGLCARYVSNSSYACFALRSDRKIAFRVSGNNTASATPPGGDIVPGTWYNVRVVARGANITAFLNGTEIAAGSRVTSGAPAAGRIALAAPGANAVFDDIVVTTP